MGRCKPFDDAACAQDTRASVCQHAEPLACRPRKGCEKQHLMLCPNDKGASFWVAVLSGDCSGMAAMPADMVARLFDGYADNFDAHLVEKLNYRTPQIIMCVTRRLMLHPRCSTF
eukprot:363790-Chlamydomonas_euryale.AAC.28